MDKRKGTKKIIKKELKKVLTARGGKTRKGIKKRQIKGTRK